MSRIVVTAVCAFALLAAACGDDGDALDESDAQTPGNAPASVTRAATSNVPVVTAAPPREGQLVTVTAIVGSVDPASDTIEINRISGAAVDRIVVEPATVIRRPDGSTATLTAVRAGDRIIASGFLSGDSLEATEIEVQQAVPGSAPGG